MNFQFTHPYWLLLLIPGLAWVVWFAIKSDVQISPWRRWASGILRVIVLVLLISAIAGAQWLRREVARQRFGVCSGKGAMEPIDRRGQS